MLIHLWQNYDTVQHRHLLGQSEPALITIETIQDGWCVDRKHFFRLYFYPIANHGG
jgi:hypothetical protein